MNSKQQTAVTSLVSLLSTIRGLNAVPQTADDNGKVIVDLGLPGFPLVSIGKQGGYGLPEIKSYPENGKPANHAFPGNTALDAVLFADMHLIRQSSPKPRKASTQTAPAPIVEQAAALATVPVAESEAQPESEPELEPIEA